VRAVRGSLIKQCVREGKSPRCRARFPLPRSPWRTEQGTWTEAIRSNERRTTRSEALLLERDPLIPWATVEALLAERTLLLDADTIVDATISGASSSTRDARWTRDPEIRQTKKETW
jgi:hypothetical protein